MITQEELERLVPKRPRRTKGWREEVAKAARTQIECAFSSCGEMAYGIITNIIESGGFDKPESRQSGYNGIPELAEVHNQWLCYDHTDWIRAYISAKQDELPRKWGSYGLSTVRSVREMDRANWTAQIILGKRPYVFSDEETKAL